MGPEPQLCVLQAAGAAGSAQCVGEAATGFCSLRTKLVLNVF